MLTSPKNIYTDWPSVFLSNANNESPRKDELEMLALSTKIDELGCYQLKYSGDFWNTIIRTPYTLNSVLESSSNYPYVYAAIQKFKKKLNPQSWNSYTSTYRDTFLHRFFTLNTSINNKNDSDAYPGIHVMCLDFPAYYKLGIKFDQTTNIALLKEKLLPYMEPGLNILLSCSRYDLISNLNDDKVNTEKGPAKGYYYLGFDKNIHYINNVIFMPKKDDYTINLQNEIQPAIFNYDKNTKQTYLNRIQTEMDAVVQFFLKREAVYFTKSAILTKLNVLVALLETAHLRTKSTDRTIPKNFGVFKLEDGKSLTAANSKNVFTTNTESHKIAGLSNTQNMIDYTQRFINKRESFTKMYENEYYRAVENYKDYLRSTGQDPEKWFTGVVELIKLMEEVDIEDESVPYKEKLRVIKSYIPPYDTYAYNFNNVSNSELNINAI